MHGLNLGNDLGYLIVPFCGLRRQIRLDSPISARRSRVKIPMARPNEADIPPKRIKRVRLGIYRIQIYVAVL